MSECKHKLVWNCGYYCGICGKNTLEICEEYDTEIALLKEECFGRGLEIAHLKAEVERMTIGGNKLLLENAALKEKVEGMNNCGNCESCAYKKEIIEAEEFLRLTHPKEEEA